MDKPGENVAGGQGQGRAQALLHSGRGGHGGEGEQIGGCIGGGHQGACIREE